MVGINMKYSFDNMHIGKSEMNISLCTQEIPRPKGLSDTSWFDFSSKVCKLLNERLYNEK